MNVTFIHRGGPMMASYRYRAAIPASFLKAQVNEGESDVYVFSKPVRDDLELAKRAKDHGAKVVADIGDQHFDNPTWGPIYKGMIDLADRVVAPTVIGADIINGHTGRKVDAVIPDPYEEALQSPHADGDKKLWFGHATNLADILNLGVKGVRLVTGPNNATKNYEQWSPEVQTRALAESNLVLLPTRNGAEYKSPNRLVNALRGGCFPICARHPAYLEFRHLVWVGSIQTGLRWAAHFHEDLNGLVAEGQKYVERFSPENVGKQWAQLLEAA